MPPPCTTSWSPLPPRTREAQLNEKWAFVARKEARCAPDDPADAREGDHRDHVAPDPEHRLVVRVVPGERTAETTGGVGAGLPPADGGPLDGPDHHRRVRPVPGGGPGGVRRDGHTAP